jgi:predicted SprT family Zn-dependent metalloprotease
MLTTTEVEQYARLTFKQYGLHDYTLYWNPHVKRTLGFANPWQKKVELNKIVLNSFSLFKIVLLHEIAHCIQFSRMGDTFKVNGRNDFHGKVFKQVCKEMGITYKTSYTV